MKNSMSYVYGSLFAHVCALISFSSLGATSSEIVENIPIDPVESSGDSLRCHSHSRSHSHHKHCSSSRNIHTVYGSFVSSFPPSGNPPVVIQPGGFIPFTQQSVVRGIANDLSNQEFTVSESGDYFVEFGVSHGARAGYGLVQLFINNTPVQNSAIVVGQSIGGAIDGVLGKVKVFVRLTEGDILTVRSVATTIVWDPVEIGRDGGTAAYLNIEKIGNLSSVGS